MSIRDVGSYIGHNRVTSTSQDSASGIWSLAAAERRRRADAWPGAFLPSSITGLQLWLDASDGSTLFDATSGGSLVAADGGVARWEDKSGNARHATQSTSASRPLRKTAIQGGKDILRFDGSNDFLQYSVPLGSSLTFFAVATPSSTSVAYMIGSTSQNGAPSFLSRWTIDGSVRDWHWYNSDLSKVIATSAPGFSVIAVTHADGGSMFSYVNGVEASTNNAVSNVNGRTMATIGSANTVPQNPYGGDIAEFLIYDSVLSSDDRASVTNYLLAKWSIS